MQLEFHHLGYATHSIEFDLKLLENLGYNSVGDTFIDIRQGVRGCFLEGVGPRIELLENLEGHNTLTPWLSSGAKVYHFAYQVNNIYDAIEFLERLRAKVISDPTPSVAFEGRNISFIMLRNKQLIELIED